MIAHQPKIYNTEDPPTWHSMGSSIIVDSTPIDAIPSLFTFGADYLCHVRSLGSGSACAEAVCKSTQLPHKSTY